MKIRVWFLSLSMEKNVFKKCQKVQMFSHLQCEESQSIVILKVQRQIFCEMLLQEKKVTEDMNWLVITSQLCNKTEQKYQHLSLLWLPRLLPNSSHVRCVKVQRRLINCWCIKLTAANTTCTLNSLNQD